MKLIDKTLFKFLFVGVLNTIFGASIMFLLYNVFKCSYWFSSCCNYIFGGILSFFLNKFFTFKNRQKSFKQIIFFIISIFICYFIAYIGARRLIYFCLKSQNQKILDNVAMFFGMCIYTALNYIAQKFIIFKGAKNND